MRARGGSPREGLRGLILRGIQASACREAIEGNPPTQVPTDRPRKVFLLALTSLVLLATSCGVVPLQTTPLTGEGLPPGYISGNIPDSYRGQRNPFALSDSKALEAGSRLYHSHKPSCADCHGESGRGNGPRFPFLEPMPADFSGNLLLAAFREHQDYVFWWVSEGVPRTSMPAWNSRMSETERWQVITYAWQLGEQASLGDRSH